MGLTNGLFATTVLPPRNGFGLAAGAGDSFSAGLFEFNFGCKLDENMFAVGLDCGFDTGCSLDLSASSAAAGWESCAFSGDAS